MQREIEAGEQVVVGVNRFQDDDGRRRRRLQRIDPAAERDQVGAFRRLRAERDADGVGRRPWTPRDAAAGTENLVPAIIDAVKAARPWARSATGCAWRGASTAS